MFVHTDSKTASGLSNVDFLAVLTWNPVNALSCVFFAYFALCMNQKVSDSRVGHHGRGDAMPFITLATRKKWNYMKEGNIRETITVRAITDHVNNHRLGRGDNYPPRI